jgi:hypothetical protein
MKTGIRNVILVLIIIAIAAVLVWKYTFKAADTNVASEKADFTLTASELLAAFEGNEQDANEKYLNKIVVVKGTVESVSNDSVGISVYLKEPDAMAGIICGFDAEGKNVSDIKKGAVVKIKGICTGYLMDVVLNKCSVEPGS